MARHSFSTRSTLAPVAIGSLVAEDRRNSRIKTSLKSRLLFAIGPTIMIALGATVVASAQSNSPFANKKKVNAWELPDAGTAPLPDVQTETTRPTPQPPTGGLMLRSRDLSAETADTPPPALPAMNAASNQATTNAALAPQATAPVQSASAPAIMPQSIPSENYVYQPSSPQTTQLSASQATQMYPPLSNPPMASQSVPSAWKLGSTTRPSASQVYNSGRTNTTAGDYANVPRGSVNSAPSRAVADDTDWTVHQLQNPVRTYPGQQANTGVAMGRFEGNSSAPGSRGQNAGQSQNPTAYDYGYRRPGEPAAEQMANRRAPTNSQYGTPDPRSAQGSASGSAGNSGPMSGPYQDAYSQSGGQTQGMGSYGAPAPAQKQGFLNRIGLGAISTLIRGALRGGVAGRENNGWEEAYVGDADIELELSAFTQGGLEWGVHGQVRAQYDEGRKGFARRLPDCPPTLAGCASVVANGTNVAVRGHTSQFYTFGPDVAKDTQIALESAHVFLRSAYGDVTVGLDDGAAYLFSLGAPSLLNVAASNSSVDYTGLDAVKTLNDASGFAEKVTYTSPRLLGDQVGVGIQFGVSYALDASACGVDYCVDLNDGTNAVAPDIQDVMEAGIALDRTFAPGVSVEATATYARGSEKSGQVGLDDLQAFGTGLEFRLNDFTLGGSYLNSNQGLMAGDYEAYDVGLTWKPSVLGFTVGYGHASDKNVNLTSDQITGGVTYDVNDRIRLGAGVQYADRDTVQNVAGTAQSVNEKATAIFIEAGITF